ncbi:MAG: hypothetical protein V3575_07105 [Candidatus Absconditabacteria bacterium]
MNFKKLFFTILLFFIQVGNSFALSVSVPSEDGGETISASANGNFVADLLRTINKYIWFAIGVAAVLVLMWGGWELMSANGDESKVKNANNILTYLVIGIIIALFAYTLIRIAANLF